MAPTTSTSSRPKPSYEAIVLQSGSIFVAAMDKLAAALQTFKDACAEHLQKVGGVSAVVKSSDAAVTRANDALFPLLEQANASVNLVLVATRLIPPGSRFDADVKENFPLLADALAAYESKTDVTVMAIPLLLMSFRRAYPSIRKIAMFVKDPTILDYYPVALSSSMGFPVPPSTRPAPLSVFAPFGGGQGARHLPCVWHVYSYFLSTASFVASASIPLNALLSLSTLPDVRRKLSNDFDMIDLLLQQVIDWADLDELLVRDGVHAESCTEAPETVEKLVMLLERVIRYSPKKWKAHMGSDGRAASGLPTIDAFFDAVERVCTTLYNQRRDPNRHESYKNIMVCRIILAELCFPAEKATKLASSATVEIRAEVKSHREYEDAARKMTLGMCDRCLQSPKTGEKMKMCSRCKVQWYCSAACQKEDWKEHKLDCVAEGQ